MRLKRLAALFLAVVLVFSLCSCAKKPAPAPEPPPEQAELVLLPSEEPEKTHFEQALTEQPPEPTKENVPDEDGYYYDLENVILYLDAYGRLPGNFITKGEARALGWDGGSVERVKPGGAIGGDSFGNRDGLLPKGKYRECDIDTLGAKKRGAKRLIYSSDGFYYYTDDHYETFTEYRINFGAVVPVLQGG